MLDMFIVITIRCFFARKDQQNDGSKSIFVSHAVPKFDYQFSELVESCVISILND